jgi:hypothetical protein
MARYSRQGSGVCSQVNGWERTAWMMSPARIAEGRREQRWAVHRAGRPPHPGGCDFIQDPLEPGARVGPGLLGVVAREGDRHEQQGVPGVVEDEDLAGDHEAGERLVRRPAVGDLLQERHHLVVDMPHEPAPEPGQVEQVGWPKGRKERLQHLEGLAAVGDPAGGAVLLDVDAVREDPCDQVRGEPKKAVAPPALAALDAL